MNPAGHSLRQVPLYKNCKLLYPLQLVQFVEIIEQVAQGEVHYTQLVEPS